jgi:hypothetical protein
MFDQLFQRASTITRHETAPYAVERERFLVHLAAQGYSYKLKIVGLCRCHGIHDAISTGAYPKRSPPRGI